MQELKLGKSDDFFEVFWMLLKNRDENLLSQKRSKRAHFGVMKTEISKIKNTISKQNDAFF